MTRLTNQVFGKTCAVRPDAADDVTDQATAGQGELVVQCRGGQKVRHGEHERDQAQHSDGGQHLQSSR